MIAINIIFAVLIIIQGIDLTVILRHSKGEGPNGSDIWDSEEKQQLHYDLQTYELLLMIMVLFLIVILL